MSAKHTPGPWALAQYAKGFCLPIPVKEHKTIAVFSVGPSHGDIAYMQHGLWGDDQALANARLIAAAPAMLEALIDCQEALRRANAYGELKVINAAIARATGTQKHDRLSQHQNDDERRRRCL